MKEKIRSNNGDLDDKEFDKIMLQDGSKMGQDPKKGTKTGERTRVIDQIKGAKKGEAGRVGSGRFNRAFDKEH